MSKGRSVWKFVLEVGRSGIISMPVGATILPRIEVVPGGGSVCLWAEVDLEQPKEVREFFIVGTGHRLPNVSARYIGTDLDERTGLVWHVYEVMEGRNG